MKPLLYAVAIAGALVGALVPLSFGAPMFGSAQAGNLAIMEVAGR
ncbi:MAG TPA: hypothetical protein VFC38_08480 [Stellaceae bacterium]|nr:hypothetical protein [Stellaceae bacterium]